MGSFDQHGDRQTDTRSVAHTHTLIHRKIELIRLAIVFEQITKSEWQSANKLRFTFDAHDVRFDPPKSRSSIAVVLDD